MLKCLGIGIIVRLVRLGHRFDKASVFCQHKMIRLLLFVALQLHCKRQCYSKKKTFSEQRQDRQNIIPINALLIKGYSIRGMRSRFIDTNNFNWFAPKTFVHWIKNPTHLFEITNVIKQKGGTWIWNWIWVWRCGRRPYERCLHSHIEERTGAHTIELNSAQLSPMLSTSEWKVLNLFFSLFLPVLSILSPELSTQRIETIKSFKKIAPKPMKQQRIR